MADDSDDYNPKKSIEKLTASLEQPDKFAKIFCEATKTQKTIDDALKCVIKSLIKEDKDTKEYIKEIIRALEKEDISITLKKWGGYIWSFFMLIVGAVITVIIRNISN